MTVKSKTIDGLPVIDAKRALKITITKADIRRADRKKPNSCAIARACKRQLSAKEVRVHLSRTYVRMNDTNWLRFMTPTPLRSEIVAFDRGGTFAPGDYNLIKPDASHKLGRERQGTSTNDNNKHHRKRKQHIITDVRTGPA